jgi:hypothetical protein
LTHRGAECQFPRTASLRARPPHHAVVRVKAGSSGSVASYCPPLEVVHGLIAEPHHAADPCVDRRVPRAARPAPVDDVYPGRQACAMVQS